MSSTSALSCVSNVIDSVILLGVFCYPEPPPPDPGVGTPTVKMPGHSRSGKKGQAGRFRSAEFLAERPSQT